MDIIEAIEKRVSCRAYEERAIDQGIIDALSGEIERINDESGLSFQLYGPRENGTSIDLSAKMFAGNPPWYAALVGRNDLVEKEKLGYFGERLVLAAEALGLSTCWVAGTYDRSSARVQLAEGEELHSVVPLGYAPAKTPFKQRTIRSSLRARSKNQADLFRGPVPLAQAPEWIRACIDGVWKGPSAINEQPVVFVQDAPDAPVRAELSRVKTGMEHIDLGIAKYHFEVVARACGVDGTWQWGEGGAFELR